MEINIINQELYGNQLYSIIKRYMFIIKLLVLKFKWNPHGNPWKSRQKTAAWHLHRIGVCLTIAHDYKCSDFSVQISTVPSEIVSLGYTL